MNIVDLEDLMEDINVYCELEKDTNLDFWKVRGREKGRREEGGREEGGREKGRGEGGRKGSKLELKAEYPTSQKLRFSSTCIILRHAQSV